MPIHTPLSFATLRAANILRLPQFKNSFGSVHSKPDGSDWSLSDWFAAILGELGETANYLKKIRRGDISMNSIDVREQLGNELADIVIYADLTLFQVKKEMGFGFGEDVKCFDSLRQSNVKRLQNDDRPNDTMNELIIRAGHYFGNAALVADIHRGNPATVIDQSYVKSLRVNLCLMIRTIDTIAFLASLKLGDCIAAKFNSVSERVGADVFNTAGDFVVNKNGERL